jgi:NAD(P)-dependent dehydrogenase (short-subunit alcohol dehydrogenase family)
VSPEQDGGKVAVITGAGSGLGRAAAELMLSRGVRVSAWDLSAQSVSDYGACGAHVEAVDVTDEQAVTAAAERVEARFGQVDAVINCAGLFLVATLESAPVDEIRTLLDVNIVGTTVVTQAVLPLLRESRGAIVNVSSIAGLKATASNSHYAASKAAIAHLTK